MPTYRNLVGYSDGTPGATDRVLFETAANTPRGVAPANLKAALSVGVADVAGLQAALDGKAAAANPTFTGTVTIPDGALAIADVNGLQTALNAAATALQPADVGDLAAGDAAVGVPVAAYGELIAGDVQASLEAIDDALAGIDFNADLLNIDVTATTHAPIGGRRYKYSNAGGCTIALGSGFTEPGIAQLEKLSGAGTITIEPAGGKTINGGSGSVTLVSRATIWVDGNDYTCQGGTSAPKSFDGSDLTNIGEIYGQLSPWQTMTGSQAGAPSGRSWKITGHATAIPVINGWHARVLNISGSSKTIAPASGVAVSTVDGASGTAITLGDDRACFLHSDGTNVYVDGTVSIGAAALAFDVFAGAVQTVAADPWAGFNITYDADADLVAVILSWENAGGATLTGITLGGVAMTRVTSSLATEVNNFTEAFYILGEDMPAGGSARAIVADFSGAVRGYGMAWSFTDAQQIAPIPVINDATGTSLALTRTGALEGGILIAGINSNDGTNVHANSFDEEDFSDGTAEGGQYGSGVRHGPVTAGNYTNTTTLSGGSETIAGTLLEIRA